MPLCPIKWQPLIFFAKLHKIALLMAIIVEGAEQLLATEIPWKTTKNIFLFYLNKLNILLANQILHLLCIFIKPNAWYSWSLKMFAIKRWFLFNFTKIFQGHHFLVVDQKTFSRHFFWEQSSKYCIVKFTTVFVCLLLSWSTQYSMKWSSNFDGP